MLQVSTKRGKLAGTNSSGAIREALKDPADNLAPTNVPGAIQQAPKYNVIIMTAGPGNPADKHIYSQALIDNPKTSAAFMGKPAFIDHPDAIQEQTLPERSVKEICGYYSQVHPEGNALCAILTLTSTPAGVFAKQLIDSCLQYRADHPGQNLSGISINADGPEVPVMVNGQQWLQVDEIDSAFSADLVTLPARGGEFVSKIQESYRKFKEAAGLAVGTENPVAMATELRDRIITLMGPEEDPKLADLRRIADNLLTALGSGQTIKESYRMANLLETKKAEAEAKTAEAEAKRKASESEAKEAHKKLSEVHQAMCAEAEAQGRTAEAAIHKAEAEKHAKMAEGDVTVQTKKDGTATVTHAAGDGSAAPPVVAPAAGSDDSEAENKKKIESLRKEIDSIKTETMNDYIAKTLKESGLPEVTVKNLRESLSGKSKIEVDKEILARQTEYTTILTSLREAGSPASLGGYVIADGSKEAALKQAGL